jgi:hypothetical protein
VLLAALFFFVLYSVPLVLKYAVLAFPLFIPPRSTAPSGFVA